MSVDLIAHNFTDNLEASEHVAFMCSDKILKNTQEHSWSDSKRIYLIILRACITLAVVLRTTETKENSNFTK